MEEIELAEPDLVPMHPEDHREAVRLLAALIRLGRPRASRRSSASLPLSSRVSAGGLPMPGGTTGNPGSEEIAGGAA
jgi:hypothetical protein